MKFLIITLGMMFASSAFALSCDCEVWVYSPLHGPHDRLPSNLSTFQLDEFGSYALKHQKLCREYCEEEFYKNLPSEKLIALLKLHTQDLIKVNVIGYNCTGLTVSKYPVRVKAKLGKMRLGNVLDIVQVVTHEEFCI